MEPSASASPSHPLAAPPPSREGWRGPGTRPRRRARIPAPVSRVTD